MKRTYLTGVLLFSDVEKLAFLVRFFSEKHINGLVMYRCKICPPPIEQTHQFFLVLKKFNVKFLIFTRTSLIDLKLSVRNCQYYLSVFYSFYSGTQYNFDILYSLQSEGYV